MLGFLQKEFLVPVGKVPINSSLYYYGDKGSETPFNHRVELPTVNLLLYWISINV